MKSRRVEPGPGQESVWDYPRPPKLEQTSDHIRIEVAGQLLAETTHPFRVLETSHPPVYYIDPSDIRMELVAEDLESFCEWKGKAKYVGLNIDGQAISKIGWYYPSPTARFEAIKDFVAFYPSKVTAFVNDEAVQSQEGDFYGGWITSNIVGPFKGAKGTWGW